MSRVFQNWRQREVLTALGLAVALVVLWRLPVVGLLFYPFRLFGTFVHELSHGIAALATGGAFVRFEVNPNLSGVAWSAGGIRWVITSAGYVGSALFGGLLIVLSARGVGARGVLHWLGIGLGVLCLLFVRNPFGILTGLAIAGALLFAAQRLNPRWADALLLLLAIQLTLDSLDSLFTLVQVSAGSRALTDAQIMARSSGVPAVVWALGWTGVSLATLVSSLRLAYRRPGP